MCRIKHVLTERAIEEPDARRSAEMKKMINFSMMVNFVFLVAIFSTSYCNCFHVGALK